MIERQYIDYLKDILNSIEDIAEFTKDYTMSTFIIDKKTINAVIRCLEIIGEASRKIPEEVKETNHAVPWKLMIGMRNKLIHDYSGIDVDMVWQVIKEDIPTIKPDIESIIKTLGDNFK